MLAINPQGSPLVGLNNPSSLIKELLLVAWLNVYKSLFHLWNSQGTWFGLKVLTHIEMQN